MDPSARSRYVRQIRLPEVGETGQDRLQAARVLIIGAGGLGSPAAMYLAAGGVGHLVITDFDRVDESNLQRQIVHRHADLGDAKAASAKRTLLDLNPRVRVDAIDYQIDGPELLEQARLADVLVDCTDNFPSRFELNRASLATDTPLVSGAAIRWQGQVAPFDPRRPDAPCFQCLYPDESVQEGIIAPLVGVIGAMQALEPLRILLGQEGGLAGRLLLFDGLGMEWQSVELPRAAACPACAG